jgi:hypothetical protein
MINIFFASENVHLSSAEIILKKTSGKSDIINAFAQHQECRYDKISENT